MGSGTFCLHWNQAQLGHRTSWIMESIAPFLNSLGVGALLAAVIGIVGYLIKSNRSEAVAANLRADDAIQDANKLLVGFMEKRQDEDSRWRDTQAAAILELATAVTANTTSLDRHTAMLQPLVETMQSMACSVQMLVEDHRKDMEAMVKDYQAHGNR